MSLRSKTSGLLGSVVHRLGFTPTAVVRSDDAEIRYYSKFSVNIRHRIPLAGVELADPEEDSEEMGEAPPLRQPIFIRRETSSVSPPPEDLQGLGASLARLDAALVSDGESPTLPEPEVWEEGFGETPKSTKPVAADKGTVLEYAPRPAESLPRREGLRAVESPRQVESRTDRIATGESRPQAEPEASENSFERPIVVPPPAGTRYAALSGQTVGVVGFSAEEGSLLGQVFAAQYCSFLTLSNMEAEFRKDAVNGCNLLVLRAPLEWMAAGSVRAKWLAKLKKPAIVEGSRDVLSVLAGMKHAGPRDFVPSPCAAEEVIWRSSLLMAQSPEMKQRRSRSKRQGRVLIADNDPGTTALIQAVLTQESMEVQVIDNGSGALEMLRATTPTAAVLEVSMPGMDGYQLLTEIRRDPALAPMVVIMLSARQSEADILKAFSLGADDYVTKPFSPLELAARLKRSLSRSS